MKEKKLEKDPFSTVDSASEIYNSLALMGSVSTKSLNLWCFLDICNHVLRNLLIIVLRL